MLAFLPFILILVFAGLTQIIGRSRIPLGTKWLILAGASLVAWGTTFAIYFRLPQTVSITNWLPAPGSRDSIQFTLDRSSWTLSMAVISMLVGIVFTDTSRLGEKGTLNEWTYSLLLTSLGLLSVLADSALVFILTWTMIDLVEIAVLVQLHEKDELSIQTIAVFIGRFLGTLFVLLASVLAYQAASPLVLSQATGTPLTLLVFGAALRLGVIPLHLPYTMELSLRRSLGSVLRLIAPLAAFMFISRLTQINAIAGWFSLLLIFAVIGALFGAVKWFTAKDELDGRPYWLLSFSSLAIVGLLNGKPESAIQLGLVMSVLGCWSFLQSIRVKWFVFLVPLAVIFFFGFPFTPTATLLSSLTVGSAENGFIFIWVSMAFLAAGIVKHTLEHENETIHVEKWRILFYIVGMVFLLFVPWIIGLWNFDDWKVMTGLIAGLATAIIFGIILAVKYNSKVRMVFEQTHITRILPLLKKVAIQLEKFFQFNWLYTLLKAILQVFEKMVNSINLILEGEGGILWALVFLVLLISLITSVKGG